jgi:very-short-patch-repair endonuclease
VDIKLEQRRDLRRRAVESEAALWSVLRAHRFGGVHFRRQHPCGPFILDFYCARHRLAIELDGGQHFEPAAQAHDARRTEYLAARGIRVLRFGADLIFRDRAGMLAAIAVALGLDDGSLAWSSNDDRGGSSAPP